MSPRFGFWLLVLVLFATTLLFTGCGAAAGINENGTWVKVTEQTQCEALEPAFCSGLFGFTIANNGSFIAGPSPTGKTVQGTIAPEELSNLTSLAQAYLSSASQSLNCENLPPQPAGIGDVIQLVTDKGSTFDVLRAGTTVCFMGNATRAAALQKAFQQLRMKYYPVPFPAS